MATCFLKAEDFKRSVEVCEHSSPVVARSHPRTMPAMQILIALLWLSSGAFVNWLVADFNQAVSPDQPWLPAVLLIAYLAASGSILAWLWLLVARRTSRLRS